MKNTKEFLASLVKRHQKPLSFFGCLRSGVKAFFTMTLLSAISYFSETPMVVAPFAASCITIYTSPHEEFAQPINVFGGYLIASLIGIILAAFLPHQWWTIGLMLALTISIMAYLRVTHPPAGAIPLLIYFYYSNGEGFLFLPTMAGCAFIIVVAVLLHRIFPSELKYPRKD